MDIYWKNRFSNLEAEREAELAKRDFEMRNNLEDDRKELSERFSSIFGGIESSKSDLIEF